MELEHKFLSDYVCDLTRELDSLSGIDKRPDWVYHYLMLHTCFDPDRSIPIRVPGGMVGALDYDEENRITAVHISIDYVVKTYPRNIKQLIESKYLGQVIEFPEQLQGG